MAMSAPLAVAPQKQKLRGSKSARGALAYAELAFRIAITACAGFAVVATLMIFAYLARTGAAGIAQAGAKDLVSGTAWKPEAGNYGGLPLIFGTVATALGAVVLGGFTSILAALWAVEFAPKWFRALYRRIMTVGVAVPSVIYGWLALVHLVPWLRAVAMRFYGTDAQVGGEGIASASILLAIMIAPTIVILSFDAMAAVPQAMRDASYALGVSRIKTGLYVVLPHVWRRLLLALFFGFGRAAGETMAVQMVIGGARRLPENLFRPTTTISTQVVMDMQNAQPGTTESNVLYSMSLVLLLLSVLGVVATHLLTRKKGAAH
jgi:phosphate transport system permease protein